MKYIDYDILDFLSDEFFIHWVKNPDENTRHFWEKWMVEHPEKREVILEAITLVRSVKYANDEEMSDKMYLDTFESIINSGKDKYQNQTSLKILWPLYLRKVVAIFILGFCGWMGFYHVVVFENQPVETEIEEVLVYRSTSSGKKSVITFGDSSKVYLNAESAIQYPKDFSKGERWVKLTGEAFFDVKKNGQTFSVYTNDTEIKVLGTSFNVKEEDDELSVALVSGKVQINDQKGNQVRLQASEMVVMKKDGNLFKTGFDALEMTGWKDRVLVFKSDSFKECKEKLEKWFGVEVSLEGRLSSNWVYSGTYSDESLENVLRGIAITSGMKYKI
ncbi:MAG: FecR family protein, partial [Cyclobacteriaceae bacterium]